MMITTKGRNALKVMIDLAKHEGEGNVSLADIAERIQESQKYLEATVASLSSAGLIISARGKSGGYRLAKPVAEYNVAEIITAAEGSLAPVSCLGDDVHCEKSATCLTLPLWRELDDVITTFLTGKSLSELIK